MHRNVCYLQKNLQWQQVDIKVLRLTTPNCMFPFSNVKYVGCYFFKYCISLNCTREPRVSSWEPFSAFNVWYPAHPRMLFSLCSTSSSLILCCPFWGPDPAQEYLESEYLGVLIICKFHPKISLEQKEENSDLPLHASGFCSSQETFSSVLHSLKHASISIHYKNSLTKSYILLSTVLHLVCHFSLLPHWASTHTKLSMTLSRSFAGENSLHYAWNASSVPR